MNQIQRLLSHTESVYRKLFDVKHKVNCERLRDACISILEHEYKTHPTRVYNVSEFYDSIQIKNECNKKNLCREKIKGIYEQYKFCPKERKVFVKLILDYLQKEVEEDFVEGWGLQDYTNYHKPYDDDWDSIIEAEPITDDESESENTKPENTNVFVAIVYDNHRNIVKNPPNGWGLYESCS